MVSGFAQFPSNDPFRIAYDAYLFTHKPWTLQPKVVQVILIRCAPLMLKQNSLITQGSLLFPLLSCHSPQSFLGNIFLVSCVVAFSRRLVLSVFGVRRRNNM